MNMINSEIFLKEKIQDKKIAIIGPADYVNKELPDTHGKYIDENFDIVIRLNSMLNIENKELEKYYGKKFDILMSSFWNENRFWETIDNKIDNILLPKYIFEEEYKNIKEGTIFWEAYNRNLFERIYKSIKSTFDSKKFIYFKSSPETESKAYSFLNSINPLLNSTPTTGMLSLGIILSHNPKEVYLSGVTFYFDDKYPSHYDKYERTIHKSINNNEKYLLYSLSGYSSKYKLNDVLTSDYKIDYSKYPKDHNFKGEQIILKHLIKNNHIKIDEYLSKLINS